MICVPVVIMSTQAKAASVTTMQVSRPSHSQISLVQQSLPMDAGGVGAPVIGGGGGGGFGGGGGGGRGGGGG